MKRKDSCSPVAYDWYKDGYYSKEHLRLRLIAEVVRKSNVHTLLDVGCGNAGLMKLLESTEVQYFGCDAYSAKRLNYSNIVEWVYEEGGDLPFEDKMFDCLVCSGFMEYIDNHEQFFSVIANRLDVGGTFVTSLMNPGRMALKAHKLNLPGGFWHPAWRSIPPWKMFVSMAEKQGLKLEALIPVYRRVFEWRSVASIVNSNWGPVSEGRLNNYTMHEGVFLFKKY